jgi:hypothetical protein
MVEDNYLKLQRYSEKLLKDNFIIIKSTEKDKVLQQIALYIDALVFNIVSILCVISVINNSSKITTKTLEVGRKYIDTKCNFSYTKLQSKMSGGRLGSATFLGATEPMYSENNPTNNLLTIDLNGEYIRPQIGGAKDKTRKIIYYLINNVLKYHHITTDKNIKEQICKIICFHLNCLTKQLKICNKPLYLNYVNKVVKKNKIFHISS